MKRFIVLIVALFCLVALRAEDKAEAKAECKCAEGEENCPCLAQSSEATPDVKVIKQKITIKNPADVQKVIAKIAKSASSEGGKVTIRVDQVKETRLIQKRIDNVKLQIRLVKRQIKVAPKARKPALIAQKQAFKVECVRLKKKLKVAKVEIKKMKVQYKIQRKAELKKKVKALIKAKNFVAVKKLKLKIHRAKIIKAKAKVKKMKKKLIKAQVKIQVLKEKKVEAERMLEKVESGTKVACDLTDKIKIFSRKIIKITEEIKKIKIAIKPYISLVGTLTGQTLSIKEEIRRQILDSFCRKLQKKLKRELKRALRLREMIAIECKKASGDVVRADTIKINKLTKELKITKVRIVQLQRAIEEAKGPIKIKMKEKLRELERKVHKIKIIIRRKVEKIVRLETKIRVAGNRKRRIIIAIKKKMLEDKIAEMRTELQKHVEIYKILKQEIAHKCEAEIEEHRRVAEAHMHEVKGKLALATGETEKLKKLLALIKKETRLRSVAERIKIKLLTVKNKRIKARLETRLLQIMGKAKELRDLQTTTNTQLISIQKEFELKAQELLRKERSASVITQMKLQKEMEIELQKRAALKKAMLETHDKNVRVALAAQRAKAKLHIEELKSGISAADLKVKSLTLEIRLRKKAISEELKEEAMKRVMYIKQQKTELLRLTRKWQEDADIDLEIVLKKLRAEYEKKFAAIRKDIAELDVERSLFAKEIEFNFKKDKTQKLLRLKKRHRVRVAEIMDKLEKAKKDHEAYEAAAAKIHTKKSRQLNTSWTIKTSKLVTKYSKMITKIEAVYRVEVKNLVRKLRQKLLTERTALRQKVAAKKAVLASLRAEWLAKEAKLKGMIAKISAENEGLHVTLDAAKDEAKTKDTEFKKEKVVIIKKDESTVFKLKKSNEALIARSRARLAKLKARLLEQKTRIEQRIVESQSQEKSLVDALATQKKSFADLKAQFEKLKTKLTTSHTAKMKIEKAKTADLKQTMSEELTHCSQKLTTAMTETKKIAVDFEAKIKIIEGYKTKAQKKKKVQELLMEAIRTQAEHGKVIKSVEGEKRSMCEVGTPGKDIMTLCARLGNKISELKKKDKEYVVKIQTLRKEYDGI